jgi:hypothetical protein
VGDPGSGKKEVAKGADICVPFKTLGVSIGKKTNIDKKINYKLVLIFWTLTKGRPKKTTYFSGAGAAVIVGDLSNFQSIAKLQNWADTIFSNVGKIPLFFIGTKSKSHPPKYLDEFIELATKYNSNYYFLSLNREDGLKIILKSIAKHLAKEYSKFILKKQSA